jgi:hypothetical protein
MRRAKIRTASEGLKLKDLIAELLLKGMEVPPTEELAPDKPGYVIDPKTGMAVSRVIGTPRAKKVSLEESLALIEQANEEESLSHAGIPR